MGEVRGLLGLGDEQLRELDRVGVELQVALLDEIGEPRADRDLAEVRIAVAEEVHADAADHVPLDAAVEQLDERPVAEPAADVGIPARAAAHRGVAIKPALEGLRERRLRRAGADESALHAAKLLHHRRDGGVDAGVRVKARGGKSLPRGGCRMGR